jgi:hypothetical protein
LCFIIEIRNTDIFILLLGMFGTHDDYDNTTTFNELYYKYSECRQWIILITMKNFLTDEENQEIK